MYTLECTHECGGSQAASRRPPNIVTTITISLSTQSSGEVYFQTQFHNSYYNFLVVIIKVSALLKYGFITQSKEGHIDLCSYGVKVYGDYVL